MMTEIRLPHISGKTEKEQLAEIKRYLSSLATELQFALEQAQRGDENKIVSVSPGIQKAVTEDGSTAFATFNSIKSLIIKSADIVNAYSDIISKKLNGEYVAKSEYGVFTEKTEAELSANAKNTERLYSNVQKIESDLTAQMESMEYSLIEVHANIKTGLLYYDEAGIPVYGLEIGQRTKTGDAEIFRKYARFTADRLSFYDQNDREVAYISDYKLHITAAEIDGNLSLGRYQIETGNGLLFQYK